MIGMPQRLATPQLTLRRPGYDDAEAIFAFASDRDVVYYMSWPAHADLDDTCDFIEAVLAGWVAGDECCWLIEESGRVIGSAACNFSEQGAELGYVLARDCWGRGLATEAVRAVFETARALDDIHRIWATCDPDNVASQRVLEKLGMAFEGRLRRYSERPNADDHDGTPRDVFMYAWAR